MRGGGGGVGAGAQAAPAFCCIRTLRGCHGLLGPCKSPVHEKGFTLPVRPTLFFVVRGQGRVMVRITLKGYEDEYFLTGRSMDH